MRRKRAEVPGVLVKEPGNNHKCQRRSCTGCVSNASRPPGGFPCRRSGRRKRGCPRRGSGTGGSSPTPDRAQVCPPIGSCVPKLAIGCARRCRRRSLRGPGFDSPHLHPVTDRQVRPRPSRLVFRRRGFGLRGEGSTPRTSTQPSDGPPGPSASFARDDRTALSGAVRRVQGIFGSQEGVRVRVFGAPVRHGVLWTSPGLRGLAPGDRSVPRLQERRIGSPTVVTNGCKA